MTIEEALSEIGCTVCHPPYAGNEDSYITYQLVGQGALYADGREVETVVTYAVDVYTTGSYVVLMLAVKCALERAGYVAVVEMEYYDDVAKRRRVNLMATIEGANYG